MKKYLYIALAATALTSCSQDETLDVIQGEAISFGNAFVGKSTRATDPAYTATTLKAFNVYGTVIGTTNTPVKIFNGNEVTRPDDVSINENATAWECNGTTQYWIAGANYKFVAIVDGNKTNVTTTNVDETTKLPTTITYNADGTTDLLCDTETRSNNTDYSLIKFQFDHLLSKVKFTVKNNSSTATNYKYTVTDIKISNSYASGTYNIDGNYWSNQNDTNTTGTSFDNITATAASQDCANEKLLIPGLTSVDVEFKVNLYYVEGTTETLISTTDYTGNNKKTADISGGMLANNAYNFEITVSLNNQIQFTVIKAPTWTDAEGEPEITV